jgi:hypothetical protein
VSFVESTSQSSDHSAAKKFQEKETYCSGFLITCRTTQADNFSAIARNFIPILIFHLAPPSKFQLFGPSK